VAEGINMCSGSGKVAANDQALQDSEIAANKAYTADSTLAFGEQQTVLAQQKARYDAEISNPLGYTTAQLHTATTSINERTSQAAKAAIGAAAAAGAKYGSSDIGGGAIGAEAGRIGTAASMEKAGELSSLSQQDEALKQEKLQAGLAGLQTVGSEYGGVNATSAGAASSSAGEGISAGSGTLAANEAGWNTFAGVLGAASGVAQAGLGIYKATK